MLSVIPHRHPLAGFSTVMEATIIGGALNVHRLPDSIGFEVHSATMEHLEQAKTSTSRLPDHGNLWEENGST